MKLTDSDSIQDAIVKLADGNPGAVAALTNLATRFDTHVVRGALRALDRCNVYGVEIYLMYRAVNGDADLFIDEIGLTVFERDTRAHP